MKRIILLVLVFVAFYGNAVCEDIAYVVTQETKLRPPDRLDGSAGTVKKGDIVYFNGKITSLREAKEVLVMNKKGQEGWINSLNIFLKDSKPLPNSIINRLWIPHYYQQFLQGIKKEEMFNYEPLWRDEYDEHTQTWNYEPDPWWRFAGMTNFLIRDSIVYVNDLYVTDFIAFATTNQKQDNNIITLFILCNYKTDFTPQNHFLKRFNVGDKYKLTLKIDGDYIDVFIDDDIKAIYTLVGVDEYFQRSINNYFFGEKIDMSKIIWPRRADGSMDYPPPAGVDLSRTYDEIIFDNEIADYIDSHESAIAQDNAENNSLPLPLLFVIIGGVVIAAGVAVVVLRKKKPFLNQS